MEALVLIEGVFQKNFSLMQLSLIVILILLNPMVGKFQIKSLLTGKH